MAGIRIHCDMLWASGVARRDESSSVVHLARVGVVAFAGDAGG